MMPGRQVLFVMVAAHSIMAIQAIRNKMDTEEKIHTEVVEGRHRAAMFFPLLLGISARLATLVPTFFIGVAGIFLFVAFAKKAFIVSLLALFLTYLDRFKKHRPKIIHVHSPGHHHFPDMEFDSFHQHHHRPPSLPPPPKFFDRFGAKSTFRKWPKIDHDAWSTGTSGMGGEFESYVPQIRRRSGDYYSSSLMYSSPSAYSPKYVIINSTEPPLPPENGNVSVTPELQKFLDKTLVEEDPR